MIIFFKKYSKYLFSLAFILLVITGAIGYYNYSEINGRNKSILECLYLSLQLFVFKFEDFGDKVPALIQVVRFLSPIAILSGLYIGFARPINSAFDSLYQQLTAFSISRSRNHIIICGLSAKAELLISDILNKKKEGRLHEIVLIESNPDHDRLGQYILKGVKIITGSALEERTLKKANVLKAKCIVTLTGCDETNIEIAKKLANIFEIYYSNHAVDPHRQLKAIIHLEDFFHLQAFKDYHEVRIPNGENLNSTIDFHATNIYKKAAQKIVDLYSPDIKTDIKPDDPQVEVLILGLTDLGNNILLEAAYIYHFLNLKKLRVHIVDIDVSRKFNNLISCIPDLPNLLDVVLIEQNDFFHYTDKYNLSNIRLCYVCKDTDGESIFYGKSLRQIFFATNLNTTTPSICVLLPKDTKILNLLDVERSGPVSEGIGLNYVNFYEDICTYEEIVEDIEDVDTIAKEIHFAYILNENGDAGSDYLEASWANINDGIKDSNRISARHLAYKLRFVGAEIVSMETFQIEKREEFDIKSLSEDIFDLLKKVEHQRWIYEKKLNGYQPCHDTGDPVFQKILKDKLKLHKDLIKYELLEEQIKSKDLSAFLYAEKIAKHRNLVLVKRNSNTSF